jgi:hypothetical protein
VRVSCLILPLGSLLSEIGSPRRARASRGLAPEVIMRCHHPHPGPRTGAALLALALPTLALPACAPSGPPAGAADAATPVDAATPADAAAPADAAVDAGPGLDAVTVDGSLPDVALPDRTPAERSGGDAAPAPDATEADAADEPDGAVPDAGDAVWVQGQVLRSVQSLSEEGDGIGTLCLAVADGCPSLLSTEPNGFAAAQIDDVDMSEVGASVYFAFDVSELAHGDYVVNGYLAEAGGDCGGAPVSGDPVTFQYGLSSPCASLSYAGEPVAGLVVELNILMP